MLVSTHAWAWEVLQVGVVRWPLRNMRGGGAYGEFPRSRYRIRRGCRPSCARAYQSAGAPARTVTLCAPQLIYASGELRQMQPDNADSFIEINSIAI